MKNQNKKLTYISLFSSAGVGCYGFSKEGFDCVATVELIGRRLDVQRHNNKCLYPSGYIADDITKEQLINYNSSDCEALHLISNHVFELCRKLIDPKSDKSVDFVDTNKLKGWGPCRFRRLDFVTPDFEYINQAS